MFGINFKTRIRIITIAATFLVIILWLHAAAIAHTVRIWNIQKGEMMTILKFNEDLISVRFSDDGKWFAALSADNKLSVWKLR